MNTRISQANRILEKLVENMDNEVQSVILHRVGSGKENGFVASIGRRISDLRQRGYSITCRKQRQPDGQVWTYYRLHSIRPLNVDLTEYGQEDATKKPPTSLPAGCGFRTLVELVHEVMSWHSDPKSPEYNECDNEPCAWCSDAIALVGHNAKKKD